MKLTQIDLKGFKSIDGEVGQSISLGDVNILLGANGSGKSNLVSFFKMLHYMSTGKLQTYVGKYGVNQLLFYGNKKTESIYFRLHFSSQETNDNYEVQLSYGLTDRLFVCEEKIISHHTTDSSVQEYHLEGGGSEIKLPTDSRKLSKDIYELLSGIRTYHFHDTSDTAKIKDRVYVDDARYLQSDASNLAAFLKMLKEHDTYYRYYERVIRHIRQAMPQFGDFSLETLPGNQNYVRLNWVDASNSNYLFGPEQISDGTLRFMALTTLLLQPPQLLPKLIVLDEPELGLHPSIIAELAGIIRAVSHKIQIIIATQSTRLVDEFDADNLVVVEWNNNHLCSVFQKLKTTQLQEWLERYSLSELWEKNVLGGGP